MADEQPKIIIDDDWKSQAKAEKEKMAKQSAAPKADAGGAAGEGGRDPGEPIGFSDLVRMLATQALLYLGQIPDPQTGRAMVALDVAKLNIDLLEVVRDKTRGNLSEEEQGMIDRTAHELRLAFVEIAEHVRKAAAEGRIGPGGEMTPPGGAAGAGPGVGPAGGPGLGGG